MLYVPVGFAHGFCVTSEVADVVYKLSSYYSPDVERGFAFNDPEVGIEWPDVELVYLRARRGRAAAVRDRRRAAVQRLRSERTKRRSPASMTRP